MKNSEFFYLQYDKIKWQNQEKTNINSSIYNHIAQNILLKKKSGKIEVFDIGFGIGAFLRVLARTLPGHFDSVTLEGCEPSHKNYKHFESNPPNLKKTKLRAFNETFLGTQTDTRFDFITSIYSFTSFVLEELEESVRKIHTMLKEGGKAIVVVSNEKYLEKKLKEKRDLFIEKSIIELDGKGYSEYLHYTELPQIGTVIDYNREEKFYIHLFEKHGFRLESKQNLDNHGFICTVFVFSK